MSDATPDKPKKSKPKHVVVRVRPSSVVDVVDLDGLQVKRGHPVRLQESDAKAAVAASRVLEIVTED